VCVVSWCWGVCSRRRRTQDGWRHNNNSTPTQVCTTQHYSITFTRGKAGSNRCLCLCLCCVCCDVLEQERLKKPMGMGYKEKEGALPTPDYLPSFMEVTPLHRSLCPNGYPCEHNTPALLNLLCANMSLCLPSSVSVCPLGLEPAWGPCEGGGASSASLQQ
jgi:hypothetical protein